MLRKRPLVSRFYLGCPLRYLKTVLILPWIYCISDKADGLHHHGWIHISRVAVPEAKTYVFLFCFVLFCMCFLSFHNRWMLKDMNYHFFLHCTIYSLPVHMYRWCMYSFLSFNPYFCLLYRHFAIGDHYAPKHNLLNIVMCHIKQLGDIFESKITHKLSLLHYTKTSY